MRQLFDLNIFSRIFIIAIISVIILYAFYGLFDMNSRQTAAQAAKVQEMIDKALVQCYALEGSYPSENDFQGKMVSYGVVLNTEKYIYHYEIFATNVKPQVLVIPIGNTGFTFNFSEPDGLD